MFRLVFISFLVAVSIAERPYPSIRDALSKGASKAKKWTKNSAKWCGKNGYELAGVAGGCITAGAAGAIGGTKDLCHGQLHP